jgi:hypothetical protein
MKHNWKSILIVLVILALSIEDVWAYRGRDPFEKPQIGLWFGPVTPVYTTGDAVDTYFGGGLFLRSDSYIKSLKIGIDGSYQYFKSKGVDDLSLWPLYGSILYRLPINFALSFQLKFGAGGCYVEENPDRFKQWDPMFMFGFETSFPAGKIINIGLRIDYLLLYEQHIKGAKRNGHIINTGITMFFNLGRTSR